MIPITRVPLSPALQSRLDAKTTSLRAYRGARRKLEARASWRNSGGTRSALTRRLRNMAQGREACMYCSDGEGASVDHYRPIDSAPMKTWVWDNHILACSICNSHNKRESFPLSSAREPLFLDPTKDDPFEHLLLSPSTGKYAGITERGRFTAETLLNRDLIERGRRAAWLDALDHVRAYGDSFAAGDSEGCVQRQFRLTQRPNLDAFYSMLKYASSPSAALVLPSDVLHVIARHRDAFLAWLGLE